MVEAKLENLTLSPLIWINTVVLLYFAGNFFYNILFANMLVVNRVFMRSTAVYIFVFFQFSVLHRYRSRFSTVTIQCQAKTGIDAGWKKVMRKSCRGFHCYNGCHLYPE